MSSHRQRENSIQFLGGHDTREPLFRDARPARRLRVLVDVDVWERISKQRTPTEATLHRLLQNERVEMSLYSDNGPPADVERLESNGYLHGDEAVGWTTLTPSDDEMVAYSVTTATRTAVVHRALITDQVLMPGWVLAEETGAPDDAAARLIATAHEIGVDILITERDAVLNTELEDRGNCRFVAPLGALSLIALYLRAAGEYVLAASTGFIETSHRRGFYDRVAFRAIPSLDTFIGCAGTSVSADRLLTITRRVRALVEARDRLALLLSEPSTDDVADAVEATFTHAMVDMVAFHDLLARVVNEMLPSPEPDAFKAKWQQEKWRADAIAVFPELRGAWGDDVPAVLLNKALRAVRNEIHDVAPVTAPFRTKWGGPEVGLAFHQRVGDKVLAAMHGIVDDTDLGIARFFADGHVFRPLVFLELVLPWQFASVNATLSALVPSLTGAEQFSANGILDSEVVGGVIDAIINLRAVTAR